MNLPDRFMFIRISTKIIKKTYLNQQTSLCKKCKDRNIIAQCNENHLRTRHNIEIIQFDEITKHASITEKDLQSKKKKNSDMDRPKRAIIAESIEKLIEPSIETLRAYISSV